MKLLFDQNLSPRLIDRLASVYPESAHVRDLGLHRAPDRQVWRYASENCYAIVSKDSDFHQLSFLYGHPPKVVWIRRGNCTTDEIEAILREFSTQLADFDADEAASYLAIS